MLKYLSLALRTTGSFTRSSMGWFRPRQRWKGVWISDFFFSFSRHENPQYRNPHGTVFLLWSTFLITEHKIAKNYKKKNKLGELNMTSGEHPSVIWCFCLAFFFSYCSLSETGKFSASVVFILLFFFVARCMLLGGCLNVLHLDCRASPCMQGTQRIMGDEDENVAVDSQRSGKGRWLGKSEGRGVWT